MSLKPTFIESTDDATECANLLILHIDADRDSAVVQCEFEASQKVRVKDVSDVIVAILQESNVVDTREITTNVSSTGSHPGRRFTITATKLR